MILIIHNKERRSKPWRALHYYFVKVVHIWYLFQLRHFSTYEQTRHEILTWIIFLKKKTVFYKVLLRNTFNGIQKVLTPIPMSFRKGSAPSGPSYDGLVQFMCHWAVLYNTLRWYLVRGAFSGTASLTIISL